MLWGLNKAGWGVGQDGSSGQSKEGDMSYELEFVDDPIGRGRGLPHFLKKGLLIT